MDKTPKGPVATQQTLTLRSESKINTQDACPPTPTDGRFVWVPSSSRVGHLATDGAELGKGPAESKLPVKVGSDSLVSSSFLTAARGSAASASLPPKISLSKPISRTLRFLVASSGQRTVTLGSLLGSLGGVVTVVGTSLQPWATSARIKRITVWPSAGGSAELIWNLADNGMVPDVLDDRTMPSGVTVTGGVVFQPPTRSLAGMWQSFQGSEPDYSLFLLSCSAGSVIDLAVDYTLCSGYAPVSASTVSLPMVLGAIYYLALDGPSSNKFVPVGLPTTS